MSLENLISTNLNEGDKIAPHDLIYISQRAKNNCYDFIMIRFLKSGITKSELARRIGKDPAQINHVLASPANWTIKTLAELLAGISKEEFIPDALAIEGRPSRNISQADLLARLDGKDELRKRVPEPVKAEVGEWVNDKVKKPALPATWILSAVPAQALEVVS